MTKTADVAYATRRPARQTGLPVTLADVYRPTGDTVTTRPAVDLGPRRRLPRRDPHLARDRRRGHTFAQKGYVNVSISYRLSPTGCSGRDADAECVLAIIDALTDAQTAVRWLRANAATYGVDPNRIAIGGSSAGAITALNVGYNGDTPAPGRSPGSRRACRPRSSISGARARRRSNAGDAPALLFHGTSDLLVPYASGKKTDDAAKAAGPRVVPDHLAGRRATCPTRQNRHQILDAHDELPLLVARSRDAAR